MISDVRYKVKVGGRPAPASLVDVIEEIVVDQVMEAVWEARLTMVMCVSDRGEWLEDEESFLAENERFRIEVTTDGHTWSPLIDGLLVSLDSTFSGDPGQSRRVLVIRDDSILLERSERAARHEDLSDSEIARRVFRQPFQTRRDDIQETETPSGPRSRECFQRDTDMAFLRRLARRNGKLAFVLPGDTDGQPRGLFRTVPIDRHPAHPPLVLAGSRRNIDTFSAQSDATSPARIVTSQLNMDDRAVTTHTVSLTRESLLGDEAAVGDDDQRDELERDQEGSCADPIARAQARADRLGHSIYAHGSTNGRCYAGVLSPYYSVAVEGISTRLTGTYQILQVTHTLGAGGYSQDFMLRRNAVARGGAGAARVQGGIF